MEPDDRCEYFFIGLVFLIAFGIPGAITFVDSQNGCHQRCPLGRGAERWRHAEDWIPEDRGRNMSATCVPYDCVNECRVAVNFPFLSLSFGHLFVFVCGIWCLAKFRLQEKMEKPPEKRFRGSMIAGDGWGSCHHWIRATGNQPPEWYPRTHECTLYKCLHCGVMFVHYGNVVKNIFEAMHKYDVPDVCKVPKLT